MSSLGIAVAALCAVFGLLFQWKTAGEQDATTRRLERLEAAVDRVKTKHGISVPADIVETLRYKINAGASVVKGAAAAKVAKAPTRLKPVVRPVECARVTDELELITAGIWQADNIVSSITALLVARESKHGRVTRTLGDHGVVVKVQCALAVLAGAATVATVVDHLSIACRFGLDQHIPVNVGRAITRVGLDP